jgi:hypothetical protein
MQNVANTTPQVVNRDTDEYVEPMTSKDDPHFQFISPLSVGIINSQCNGGIYVTGKVMFSSHLLQMLTSFIRTPD